jgi:hypothetical protein
MHIDLDKDDLKQGVMGLVMALVEIIRDTLQTQSLKRMEGGTLSPDQIEKLGNALMKLDEAIEKIKTDNGISESVQQVRDGLDDLVGDLVETFCNPVGSAVDGQRARREPLSKPGGRDER